jgi:hypothetical protein
MKASSVNVADVICLNIAGIIVIADRFRSRSTLVGIGFEPVGIHRDGN